MTNEDSQIVHAGDPVYQTESLVTCDLPPEPLESHYVVEKDVMLHQMLQMQLMEVKHYGNTHLAQYSVSQAFRLIGDGTDKLSILLHNCKVKLCSQRYSLFQNQRVCVNCGVEGKVFCLDLPRSERQRWNKTTNPLRAHFNLYGIMSSGRIVMLTKDHIVPSSKGGKCVMSNYQCMCETCNAEKGDR